MFSLNEDISLNEYNFIKWTDKFLEMNVIYSFTSVFLFLPKRLMFP